MNDIWGEKKVYTKYTIEHWLENVECFISVCAISFLYCVVTLGGSLSCSLAHSFIRSQPLFHLTCSLHSLCHTSLASKIHTKQCFIRALDDFLFISFFSALALAPAAFLCSHFCISSCQTCSCPYVFDDVWRRAHNDDCTVHLCAYVCVYSTNCSFFFYSFQIDVCVCKCKFFFVYLFDESS